MATTDADMAPSNTIAKELRDLNVTIAVDISASTKGLVLENELQAVKGILGVMNVKSEDTVTVLQWDKDAHTPILLPSEKVVLDHLRSGDGTKPSRLFKKGSYIQALQQCGIWFLFTDGFINEREIQRFSQSTTKSGMHGYANIIVVFGASASGPPSRTNFSVALTTYAVAPDCLFLFHDVCTRKVYLLQAKGCFKSLLSSDAEQPVLDEKLTWQQLPRIRYQDLAKVEITPPTRLTEDQTALSDGFVIRLKDVYEGNLSKEDTDRMTTSGHLKSIAMHEFASGNSERYQAWVSSRQQALPTVPEQRPDKNGGALRAIMILHDLIKAGAPESQLSHQRLRLQAAHEANSIKFQKVLLAHQEEYLKTRTSNNLYEKSTNHITSLRNLSLSGRQLSSDSAMGYEMIYESDCTDTPVPTSTNVASSAEVHPRECFLPGFHRSPDSELVGNCMLCDRKSVLALMLQHRPPQVLQDSIGNIFSTWVCCDACAYYLSGPGADLMEPPIVGAIALVSLTSNRVAWTANLRKVIQYPTPAHDNGVWRGSLRYSTINPMWTMWLDWQMTP